MACPSPSLARMISISNSQAKAQLTMAKTASKQAIADISRSIEWLPFQHRDAGQVIGISIFAQCASHLLGPPQATSHSYSQDVHYGLAYMVSSNDSLMSAHSSERQWDSFLHRCQWSPTRQHSSTLTHPSTCTSTRLNGGHTTSPQSTDHGRKGLVWSHPTQPLSSSSKGRIESIDRKSRQ